VSTLLHYPLPMVATRNHESRKGHRLDRHLLLKELVEQLAPVPRHPAIKTVGNLPRRRHTTHWAWLTQVDTPLPINRLIFVSGELK
ncbi:MAG: hypothetical protein ACE10H_00205, partial [Candidatus Binatia bacterium]